MASSEPENNRIFVTGATGYVGGRLVPALLAAGYQVRCLAREPRKLEERPWRSHPSVQVEAGDMSDVDQLVGHLNGCSVAYYLVHSMEASGREYAERDRHLASNFAIAAKRARVGRIIYLGGLGELGEGLSQHLRSRRDVEAMLASAGVALTTLRAAMIIGSGSASFEILRYLVERLPVMVTPAWVKTESQPVAIRDVLHWLVECLRVSETKGKTLEIGGPDVLPYLDLMRIMAEELHLSKRWIIPVPVLTPRLSSLWISLVTPVSYRIARPLAEGLRNRVVVTNGEAQRLMPHQPIGVREAIRQALKKVEAHEVETRWSAAGRLPGDPHWAGGTVFTDQRSVSIQATPRAVYAAVCRIGGGNGWYADDVLWRIRGWMDTVVGGPGLRRGRRDPEHVEYGEALDFWRVVGIDRDRSLSLRAEMKLPGEALLNFELEPEEDKKRTQLTMTAKFRPRGLLGILYWYAVCPLHNLVFGGMLRGIRKTAEANSPAEEPPDLQVPREVQSSSYGRARLWLGISAVGSMVTLTALGLALDVPGQFSMLTDSNFLGSILGLMLYVLLYAAIQLPFDFLGGFVLPRRYGRSHLPFGSYVSGLARAVFVHAALLFLAAVLLMLAGQLGGIAGTVAAGAALIFVLLHGRLAIAAMLAPVELSVAPSPLPRPPDDLPVKWAWSPDEGFTGGVAGVLRPDFHLLPMRWQETLGPERCRLELARRSFAVSTGSWWRGRALALLFTLGGLTVVAFLVGPQRLGTASGTIELSLWFTLWSFLGLLTLPTLSRRGVLEIDEQARAAGWSDQALRSTAHLLDELQDGEPTRPSLVETVFHPIPSVQNRLDGPRTHGVIGFWDSARTAVYLSMAGLGLLSRAVHCNCGRPSLWVFLPTD